MTADDQRAPGEAFCAACPDHEACATGWPCWKVQGGSAGMGGKQVMDERYVVREGPGGTRLAGHSLWREGKPYGDDPTSWNGRGRCSCGALSDVLTSNYQRKKWHAAHKTAVARGEA